MFIEEAFGVGLFVGEIEDVAGGGGGVHFFEGAGIDEHGDAGGGAYAKVIMAGGTGVVLFFHGLAVDHGGALSRAFEARRPSGDVNVFFCGVWPLVPTWRGSLKGQRGDFAIGP